MEQEKSLGTLMRDLLQQLSTLVRDEIQLARAEMTEKTNQVAAGAGMLGAALAFGIGAIVILLLALVLVLDAVMQAWLAALLVGIAAAVVAMLLMNAGRSKMKARNLAPNRTIDSVRRDGQLAREKTV
jgi:uncharacterized membrane protein YqjE